MNKPSLALVVYLLMILQACSPSKSISNVSLLSERDIDFTASYEMKALSRTATANTIQQAVAAIIETVPNGLFIKNVKIIYLKKSKTQVTGDVWGKISDSNGNGIIKRAPPQIAASSIIIGDNVKFVNNVGSVKTGKVVSLKGAVAVVQFLNRRRQLVLTSIPIIALKKI